MFGQNRRIGGGKLLANIGKILVLSIFVVSIFLSFDTLAKRKNVSGRRQSSVSSSKRSASSRKSNSVSKSSKRSASSKKSSSAKSSKRSASSKKNSTKTKLSKKSNTKKQSSTSSNKSKNTSSTVNYDVKEEVASVQETAPAQTVDTTSVQTTETTTTTVTTTQETPVVEEKKEEVKEVAQETKVEPVVEENVAQAQQQNNTVEEKKESEISEEEKYKYINVKEKIYFVATTEENPEPGKVYPAKKGNLQLPVGCYDVLISGSGGSPSNNCKSQWGTLGSRGEEKVVSFCVKSGTAILEYELGMTARFARGQCSAGEDGWSSYFVVNGDLDEKYSAIKSGKIVVAFGGKGGPASFHDKQKDENDKYFVAEGPKCDEYFKFEISNEYGFGSRANYFVNNEIESFPRDKVFLYVCTVVKGSNGKYASKVDKENNNYKDDGGYIWVRTVIPKMPMY